MFLGQPLQRFLVRRLCNAPLGNDCRDQSGWGHVESGIFDLDAIGDHLSARDVRNLFAAALLNRDAGAIAHVEVDGGNRGGDIKRNTVFLRQDRQGVRSDLVGYVAIRRNPIGADPIVVAVSVTSGELSGFLVRKAEKQHGTGQRIEGFRKKGARVVIVDDVCTSGASTIQAIEAAREFGFDVVGAMCLVEREEAGGRRKVEQAATPAPFVSVFSASDVRKEHVLQTDDTTELPVVNTTCEICGLPAVTHYPRSRCETHKN